MTDPDIANNPAQQNGWRTVLITGAITAFITLVFMVLSALTGGFASYSQEQAEAAQSRSVTIPIIIHLSIVLPSVLIGGVLLVRREKGDEFHKILGRPFGVLMMITAIASFWIGRPGTGIAGSGFSFIHLFSLLTLFSVPWAVYAVRNGNIARHEATMRGLYIGLIIAGLFTLIPGRLLGNLVF